MEQKERDPFLDTFTKFSRAHSSLLAFVAAAEALPEKMTITQFGVLEVLYHKGALTHCEIAKKILKSKGNLTMVIDHLERDGLVERRPVAGDRRAVSVALTPSGEERIKLVFPKHAEAIRSGLSILTPSELTTLGSICRKLGLGLTGMKESSSTPGGVR